MLQFLGDEIGEVFRTWFRDSPQCLLISGSNGEIFATNAAFERWTGYTSGELKQLGWQKLSKNDDDFAADIEAVKEVLEGHRLAYSVRKHYIPKGKVPQAGQLSVVRYPSAGTVKWLLCVWQPEENATAAALAIAMDHIKRSVGMIELQKAALNALDERLKEKDKTSDGERLWLLTGKLMIKHPRTTWAILIAMISLFVSANLLSILKNLAGIETSLMDRPAATEPKERQQATGIAAVAKTGTTITTAAGHRITIGSQLHGVRERISGIELGNLESRRAVNGIRPSGGVYRGSYWRSGDEAGGVSDLLERWRAGANAVF